MQLLNNISEDCSEDNDYNDRSNGRVNTDKSVSNENEVEEVMVNGLTATNKEQAGFPFTANSSVQINVNNIQNEREYVDLFIGEDLL